MSRRRAHGSREPTWSYAGRAWYRIQADYGSLLWSPGRWGAMGIVCSPDKMADKFSTTEETEETSIHIHGTKSTLYQLSWYPAMSTPMRFGRCKISFYPCLGKRVYPYLMTLCFYTVATNSRIIWQIGQIHENFATDPLLSRPSGRLEIMSYCSLHRLKYCVLKPYCPCYNENNTR